MRRASPSSTSAAAPTFAIDSTMSDLTSRAKITCTLKPPPKNQAGVPLAPPEGVILVFTDGACFGNPGPAGLGFILAFGEHRKEVSRYLGEGTNNIAELSAIHDALESIQRREVPVRIYTDSSYAIGVLTKGWKAKANQALIADIRVLMEGFEDLAIEKVKGHAGHPLNERADELAREAIEQAQQRGDAPATKTVVKPSTSLFLC